MKLTAPKLLKIIKTIQILIVIIAVVILSSLIIFATNIKNSNIFINQYKESENTNGDIQTWIISPAAEGIVSGNTEVVFFAKDTANPDARFSFILDLYKNGRFVKNLFSVGIDQNLINTNGVRSRFVDFTGLMPGDDYILKLATIDNKGEKIAYDYSDKKFTIAEEMPNLSAELRVKDSFPEVTINTPSYSSLSLENSQIESVFSNNSDNNLQKITVEITNDGTTWKTVYSGKEKAFNLDISTFKGGNYILKFTYDFGDGTQKVKSNQVVHIIEQNSSAGFPDILLTKIKPQNGEKFYDTNQVITFSFNKINDAKISSNNLKIYIDGKSIESGAGFAISDEGLVYLPEQSWSIGKHDVFISIDLGNNNLITRIWTFEVLNKYYKYSQDQIIFEQNKWIVSVEILGIVVICFLYFTFRFLEKRRLKLLAEIKQKK